ncbi:MAG: cell envelope biosis protein TolA [Caulobacter sp.]|nr:cell envelope biosis protein TolA [Caulobacter sp.]
MARERRQLAPALIASVVVHLGVGLIALFAWPHQSKPITLGAVPVTIVTDGPAELRKSQQGPEELDALTEEPIPELPPEPVAPPAPEPTPKPEPVPAKAQEKAKPTPSPTPKKQANLDFDDLEKRLQKAGGGQPKGGGAKGPPRPPTSPKPAPKGGAGGGPPGEWLQGLLADLYKYWRPNCFVEGGRSVRVSVKVVLSQSGRVIGEPEIVRSSGADPSLVEAGKTRAILAVNRAQPFKDMPAELAGDSLTLNFDAQKACAL